MAAHICFSGFIWAWILCVVTMESICLLFRVETLVLERTLSLKATVQPRSGLHFFKNKGMAGLPMKVGTTLLSESPAISSSTHPVIYKNVSFVDTVVYTPNAWFLTAVCQRFLLLEAFCLVSSHRNFPRIVIISLRSHGGKNCIMASLQILNKKKKKKQGTSSAFPLQTTVHIMSLSRLVYSKHDCHTALPSVSLSPVHGIHMKWFDSGCCSWQRLCAWM